MDEQTNKEAQELITIAGGVEMEVNYQNNGDKEIVKVRQIPVSKFQNYIIAMGNVADSIELYCDKPKGWADTLTLESAGDVYEKGVDLNLPFFERWFRIQMRMRASQQLAGSTTSADQSASAAGSSSSPSANSPPQSPITTS